MQERTDKGFYARCLEELCGTLKEEGRYEEILELARMASQLHPYDGWQSRQWRVCWP